METSDPAMLDPVCIFPIDESSLHRLPSNWPVSESPDTPDGLSKYGCKAYTAVPPPHVYSTSLDLATGRIRSGSCGGPRGGHGAMCWLARVLHWDPWATT